MNREGAYIETSGFSAHIFSMTAVAKRQTPSKRPVYRGVALPALVGVQTRFTKAQLKKAVEAAVTKNADALAASK